MIVILFAYLYIAYLVVVIILMVVGDRKNRATRAKRGIIAILAPLLLAGVSIGCVRSGLLDCPTYLSRHYIHRMDRRILNRLLGAERPKSFTLLQADVPAYDFPCPDGPSPACYLIQLDARDLPVLMKARHWENKDQDMWSGYSNLEALVRLNKERFRQLVDSKLRERPLPINLYSISNPSNQISFGKMLIDEQSSPSLTLYLSTKDNYLDPMQVYYPSPPGAS